MNSRRLSGWKTPRRAIWSSLQVKSVRLMVRFDRETELFCRPPPSPPPGALKIVFQLEMLSDGAPLDLREPDNFSTFVFSPPLQLQRNPTFRPLASICFSEPNDVFVPGLNWVHICQFCLAGLCVRRTEHG